MLKDAASASLYGSRSGNGVVLITTKKGKSGKAEFGLNFSQSISFLPSTPLQMRGHGERRVHNILAQHQRIGHNDYTTNRYILPPPLWGILRLGAYPRRGLRLLLG